MRALAKIHPHYVLFSLVAGGFLGFSLSAIFEISSFGDAVWPILAGILAVFAVAVSRRYCIIVAILAAFLLSFWRMSSFWQAKNTASKFVDQTISLAGVAVDDASVGEDEKRRVVVDDIKINGQKVNGRVVAFVGRGGEILRGDRINVAGKFSASSGDSVGVIFRGKITSHEVGGGSIVAFRKYLSDGIRSAVGSPEADLGLGYVLGDKNGMSEELKGTLKATALSHVVVASGLHLTILAGFSKKIFEKVSRKLTLFLTLSLTLGFVAVAGFSPSATRAGVVAILGLIFWFYGRRANAYFLILLVACVTLFLRPENILNLGWQLSFLSFFGVMILSALIKKFFFEKPHEVSNLVSLVIATISAQITTLPLVIYTFGAFSTVSILANIFVVPLVPFAMIFTFLAGILSGVFPFLAGVFGMIAKFILGASIQIVDFFAKIPGAQIEFEISLASVAWCYVGVAVLMIFLELSTREISIFEGLKFFEKNAKIRGNND